jgi:hypothetical protein
MMVSGCCWHPVAPPSPPAPQGRLAQGPAQCSAPAPAAPTWRALHPLRLAPAAARPAERGGTLACAGDHHGPGHARVHLGPAAGRLCAHSQVSGCRLAGCTCVGLVGVVCVFGGWGRYVWGVGAGVCVCVVGVWGWGVGVQSLAGWRRRRPAPWRPGAPLQRRPRHLPRCCCRCRRLSQVDPDPEAGPDLLCQRRPVPRLAKGPAAGARRRTLRTLRSTRCARQSTRADPPLSRPSLPPSRPTATPPAPLSHRTAHPNFTFPAPCPPPPLPDPAVHRHHPAGQGAVPQAVQRPVHLLACGRLPPHAALRGGGHEPALPPAARVRGQPHELPLRAGGVRPKRAAGWQAGCLVPPAGACLLRWQLVGAARQRSKRHLAAARADPLGCRYLGCLLSAALDHAATPLCPKLKLLRRAALCRREARARTASSAS